MDHTHPSTDRTRQAVTGLALAAAVFGGWLALHIYALFVFELTWASLPLALTMAAVQCWLSVGLFIVSHDAMHGSLVPGRPRANAAIGAALLFLYAGFPWKRMREAHFAHHRHVGTNGDPDFDAGNPRDVLRWYGTFLKRYFGWSSLVWVNGVVALYWLVFDVPMAQLVLLYGLPAIASSFQLFYFGTYRPHRHAAEPFPDRHNARSDDFGTLASLFTCFHFGYHLEHHHRPQLPWWALPAARRSMRAEPGRARSGAVKEDAT
ncbi:fatty acid desaturase [Alteriqipengyuania lutimaris]|uniref:Beta-carotene ketolase n=1 Tax=Alteriqipengyuania lutimaris TaxID=1538146 RepID=A0A395LMM4_9SPHN|nr:fatty acid desaturase [Alteriqipengyuania lutimaris]MBB3032697.1 beta-carotene ketolase (CrtW type) [Alteriqipengyuania lutimaris]RDS78192.1 beta-carotene ketolase [Alteriqipengyuania lutimaris]